MKAHILVAAIFLLVIRSSAQELYIKGGFGYAIPQAGQSVIPGSGNVPYNGTVSTSGFSGNSWSTITYNYKNASFLGGVNSNIGAGYMFTKNIGIEIDASELLSPQKNIATYGEYVYYRTEQYATSSLLLSPQLLLNISLKKVDIYTRLGLALPLKFQNHIKNDQISYSNQGTLDFESNTNLKFAFSLGYTAAGGVDYHINKRVSLWCEANMVSLSLYTKSSYTAGVNSTGVYTNSVKYSNNFTNTSNNSVFTQPAYTVPFSNIGISAGVKISIWNKPAKKTTDAH